MANKTIYICDRCHSYAENKDIYKITISGFQNISTMSVFQRMRVRLVGSTCSVSREICATCLDKIIDDMALEKKTADVTREVFANFSIPQRNLGN